jgi:large subunit ribosomal protein L3
VGHRKKHAPKRGSLAYLPRGRAKRWIGRIRFWPAVEGKPKLLAFVGYKAGMTHVTAVDNRHGSLTYGREISIPVTIVETPPMLVCGIRAYVKTTRGLKTFAEAWMENPPKDLGRLLTLPEKFDTENSLKKIQNSLGEVAEIRVLLATQPRLLGKGVKKPQLVEVKVGGGTVKEQFEYARSILGREVKVSDAFKEGQWVDVVAVTKGKGIQGPVKRWGVRILSHKSRKTKRGVGSIGPWTPAYVMYSVPRAGQMGFFQRTEYNKQILKIGGDGAEVTPKGGFIRYGNVSGDYLMLKGSIPGPAKRLVTLRHAARAFRLPTAAPKIEYVSLESKQAD